jgi:hypothetical protein
MSHFYPVIVYHPFGPRCSNCPTVMVEEEKLLPSWGGSYWQTRMPMARHSFPPWLKAQPATVSALTHLAVLSC